MGKDADVKFRADAEEVEAWRLLAAAEGVGLSEWLRGRAGAAESLKEAKRAHAIVTAAIASGKLEREPCEICGATADAHHDDYSQPLRVRWLCRAHHRQWHRDHPSGIAWTLKETETPRHLRDVGERPANPDLGAAWDAAQTWIAAQIRLRRAICAAVDCGVSLRAVGEAVGLTHSRVHQIIHEERKP